MSIFKKLSSLMSGKDSEEKTPLSIEEAVAGLMLEAASLDQDFSDSEKATLLTCLAEAFDLEEAECQQLLDLVQDEDHAKAGVHPFVRLLNQQLDEDHRFEVMVRVWQVVLADGRIDDIEKQFMRRLAPLLHISDRDSGLARIEAEQA